MDMDCFFVACELLSRPYLAGKPVAVGGRPEERGVISTASYEARRAGVHSALSSKIALQRCPNLVLLNHNFSKYEAMSNIIHEVFAQHAERVSSVGLDEAYLDFSHLSFEEATTVAQNIKLQIFQKTRLVASAGLAPNPYLAKIASDWKKPNGFFVLHPHEVEKFVEQLPVRTLPGVGEVTEARLLSLGAKTTGDLRRQGESWLTQHFGRYGEVLWELCRGVDSRDIFTQGARRSLSIEHTFIQDLKTAPEWEMAILDLAQDWKERLAQYRLDSEDPRPLKNIFIKLKFSDFKSHTLAVPFTDTIDLNSTFLKLIQEAFLKWPGRAVRLLGVGGHFVSEEVESEDEEEEEQQLLLPLLWGRVLADAV
ncbi:MAG: hypothetical protein A2X86_02010 [Bdellovibrionales bacterium GWA2_49_15]|nr:MAG: hypothetical protein A2X86_02010 [Bdellovibrionales bacterium GWA2_49_15]